VIQHLVGLSHWQISLLVIYLFIQGAFFTVFPEEVVLPTLGVLWGQGRIGFVEAFAAAFIGLVIGDLILVFIGRHLIMKLLVRKPFSWLVDPEALGHALEKVRKHGPWLIFGVRFTPMIRAPMYFASGLSKMNLVSFARSDMLAMLLWIPGLMWVGQRMGASGSIEQAFHKIGILMASLIIGGILFSVLKKQKKRLRQIPNTD
jgi:membrane protein DedA with SNARE-associated domain